MPRIEGAWRGSAHGGGWMLGEPDAAPDLLRRRAAELGEAPFLDFSGEWHSYAGVEAESLRLARGLADAGVRAGDTVTSVLDNGISTVLLMFAVQRLGAVHVPINTALKGEYLRHQVADSGARIVVAESDYAGRVLAVADGVPEVRLLLHRGERPDAASGRVTVQPLDSLRLDSGEDPTVAVDPGDLGMIIYTAGTTGPSKGCALSHAYVMRMANTTLYNTQRTPDEVNWNPAPLFHLNAVSSVLGSMLLGSSTSIAPRFSVSGFWPEIERTGARVVNLLGTMIPLIAAMADTAEMARCRGAIRAVLGAPFTAETERVWRERFGVQQVGNPFYGLSECAPLTAATLTENRPGACGKVVDDLDVRIFDDDDNELGAGEVGEVVCRPLRPHAMFQRYWRRPEATMAVTRNLWYHTGDLGMFDADGWFYFVDRKKDYLRRGGENISSFEMEAALAQHPDIAEVAVHAVLSDLSEDEVKATVVLAPGSGVTEGDLCEWAIERVPYFAVPRYIEFREELPKNGVGRVLKYQLRDEGRTERTWDRVEAGLTVARR